MENKVKLTETDASRLIEALPALYPADFERIMMLYNKGLLCAPMSVAPQLVRAILAEYRRRATSVNPCQYRPIPGKSGSRGRKNPAKGTSLGSPKSTKNPKGKMYRIPEEELDLVLSLRPGQVYQSYSGPGGTQMDIKRLDAFRYQVWEQAGNKSYIITSNSLHLLFPKGRKGQATGHFKNPRPVGPVEPYCDFGHMSREVRALPLGGGGNALLCRHHYEQEKKARAEEGVSTPEWKQLRLYIPNPRGVYDRFRKGQRVIMMDLKGLDSRKLGYIVEATPGMLKDFGPRSLRSSDIPVRFDDGTETFVYSGFLLPVHPDFGGKGQLSLEQYTQAIRLGMIYSTAWEKRPNPLTGHEKSKLWEKAADHMRDSIEHKDPELKALDKGTALGIKEAIATLENPAHPFVYLPKIVEPGAIRTVAPRNSLNALVDYFKDWGAKVDEEEFKTALRNLVTGREIEMPGGHPFRKFYVTRVVRVSGRRYPVEIAGLDNPMRKRFKPYYKRWDEYMGFLEETLIPDLKESGSSYAEDFSRILAMLKGEEEIDKKYILWLRTTLIPDSIESGYTSTAHSLQEGLWWLALSESGRKTGIQHRNPIGKSSCENILRHAKIIGTDCLAVEYMDVPKAKREGVRNPDRPWRHDFKVKGIKVWGLKDGSVLLVGPKPLWRSQPNSVTGK